MEVKETEENNAQQRSVCLDIAPNPCNNRATISFTVAKPVDVTCSIYDAMGRRVITIASGYHSKGSYSYKWDGMTRDNQQVKSGVYFVRITTPQEESYEKLILLK